MAPACSERNLYDIIDIVDIVDIIDTLLSDHATILHLTSVKLSIKLSIELD